MSNNKQEINALSPITKDEKQGWIPLAFIQAGICVCVPSFLEGALLVEEMNFWPAILSGIVGYVLVVIAMTVLGFIGSDLGLASCTITEASLGKKGARYIAAVVFAINLVGWFGINNQKCAESFVNFLDSNFGIAIPYAVSCLFWGIIMTITAAFGMKAMEKLDYVSVPLLLIVMIIGTYLAIKQNGIGAVDEQITPMACATNFGETVILKEVVNDLRAEAIVRAIAVASGNEVGVADHPMRGKVFRESVIKGAITYALQVGRTLREARESGRDAAEAIASGFSGKVLFRGVIKQAPWELQDGFTRGKLELAGIGSFANETYTIHVQNENIYAERNGALDICVPDLICVLDENGNPVTNPNWKLGQQLSVIGLPSPDIWKTPAGQKVFSTESFRLGFAYRSFL